MLRAMMKYFEGFIKTSQLRCCWGQVVKGKKKAVKRLTLNSSSGSCLSICFWRPEMMLCIDFPEYSLQPEGTWRIFIAVSSPSVRMDVLIPALDRSVCDLSDCSPSDGRGSYSPRTKEIQCHYQMRCLPCLVSCPVKTKKMIAKKKITKVYKTSVSLISAFTKWMKLSKMCHRNLWVLIQGIILTNATV